MDPWATKAQAWEHWPDSQSVPDASLDTLLAAATEQCFEYAPSLSHLVDAVLVSGSTVATAFSTALFDQRDIGATVDGSGIALGTTITAVSVSGQTATLSLAATATLALTSLGLTRPVPESYMLATIFQARELRAGGEPGGGDVVAFGEYALRRRPLSATVKSLLRPVRGLPKLG